MYFSFESFKARLIKYLEISPSAFDEGLMEWIEKNGDGILSRNTYLCDLYHSLVNTISKTATSKHEQYFKQRFIYGELYAYKCYHDEDCNEVLRHMHNCDLHLANSENIKVEAFIQSGKCCPECDKQHGKVYSMEQALLLQPLPNPRCTNEDGCICSYGFHSVRDKNNRFIKNERV